MISLRNSGFGINSFHGVVENHRFPLELLFRTPMFSITSFSGIATVTPLTSRPQGVLEKASQPEGRGWI